MTGFRIAAPLLTVAVMFFAASTGLAVSPSAASSAHAVAKMLPGTSNPVNCIVDSSRSPLGY